MSKVVIKNKEELKDLILNIQGNEEELKSFNDKYDYSSITNMNGMFDGCTNLKSIPELDTSNVKSMNGMFYDCKNLETIPLLNTNKAKYMSSMFNGCEKLETIPELDTSNVEDMIYMFEGCKNLKEIPKLDISKIPNEQKAEIQSLMKQSKPKQSRLSKLKNRTLSDDKIKELDNLSNNLKNDNSLENKYEEDYNPGM